MEINIPSEWICRGSLTMAEAANELPTSRVSLQVYTRPAGKALRTLMDDDTVCTVIVRGIRLRFTIQGIETRGTVGDVLHLHGPCEILTPIGCQ